MIAVDTNILAYAHRRESPFHRPAFQVLKALCEGVVAWCVPWPCVHEFIAVVTNQRAYLPASTAAQALMQINAWHKSGVMQFIGEGPNHLVLLSELSLAARISSGQIHDARIAAICLQHGVKELWTADRDFSRYPKLKTKNPLVT